MLRSFLRLLDKRLSPSICWFLFLLDVALRTADPKGSSMAGEGRDFRNILVVKIAGMGDTVLMLPALKALREAYPRSKISALVTPLSKGILVNQPVLDDVIIYDISEQGKGVMGLANIILGLRRREFDLVIDFDQPFYLSSIFSYSTGASTRVGYSNLPARGRLLTRKVVLDDKKHACDSFADLVRSLGVNFSIEDLEQVWVPEADSRYVRNWLEKVEILEDDFVVGIHPGSGGNMVSRRWRMERFAELADKLSEVYEAKVVITGGASELGLARDLSHLMKSTPIVAAGQISVGQLAELISKLNLYISNDTGPMHISAAMGTPTIGLFGPDTPVRYGPYGGQHLSIYAPPPCSPCINIHKGVRVDCKHRSPLCLEMITVEDVWEAVEKLMKRNEILSIVAS